MKTSFTILFSCFLFMDALAQVGIGTTSPNAQLDIIATNQATPLNTDGILIPKIDEFPVTSPTSAQDGMMVFVTGAGTPSKGFYYWDNSGTSWVPFNGSSEWTDNGTYLTPADGYGEDVAIGGGASPIAKLSVISDKQVAANIYNSGTYDTQMSGISVLSANNSALTTSFTSGVNVAVNSMGQGTAYGTTNSVFGNGNGGHYGVFNNLSGNGSGNHIGIQNQLLGTGTGNHTGTYNSILVDTDGTLVGTSNVISGSGEGPRYGVYNFLFDPSNGPQYGISNAIYTTETTGASHYGSYLILQGSGDGERFGSYSLFQGIGNGNRYGSQVAISNPGNGVHYGAYHLLSGAGSGDKYGTYNFIPPVAGGTNYGVYSNVLKAGSYAGYFLGNVAIGTVASNTYTLPASRGANGQVIQTDGSGNLSWQTLPSANDADWFEANTTSSPSSINSSIYTLGNVGIGHNNPGSPIHIVDTGSATTLSIDKSGSFGGSNWGLFSDMNISGNSVNIGAEFRIRGTTSGNNYGLYHRITTSGIGTSTGWFLDLDTTNGGVQTGMFINIDSTNDEIHYGTFVNSSGIGTGAHYGNFTRMEGNASVSGNQIAQHNEIINIGNGTHYGTYNSLIGSGSGDKYGTFNSVNASGTNNYGTYNSIPTIGGVGATNYATYNYINPGSTALNYGVYSEVLSSNSFAGYFLGNVAIGTTNANTYTLPASRGANGQIMRTDAAGIVSWQNMPATTSFVDLDGDTQIQVEEVADEDKIRFDTNGVQRMLIDANGVVGINTNNPADDLHVKGDIRIEDDIDSDYWYVTVDAANDYNFHFNGTLRSYINDADGSYNMTSDRNLKDNIKTMNSSVAEKVFQLNPVNYTYKDDATQTNQYGFIAQEVQKLFPELVTEKVTDKDTLLTLNYQAFGVLAIKTIQEQQKEIDTLKEEISELKKLEARIEKLEMN